MTASHAIGDQPPIFASGPGAYSNPPTQAPIAGSCGHCGAMHAGTCPRIKSISYFPNGQISSVEYHAAAASVATVTVKVEAIAGCGDPAPHAPHYAALNERPYICPGNSTEGLLPPPGGPQDVLRGTAEGTAGGGATGIAPLLTSTAKRPDRCRVQLTHRAHSYFTDGSSRFCPGVPS